MSHLSHWLAASPFLALFITIAGGYFIGKFRIKTFVLGGIAGSLIIGVIVGQLNIVISPEIGSMFFALFIFAVGYQGGPQFFKSLNRQTLVQLISATLTCIFGLLCVLIAAWWFGLDRGMAAGLGAGGLTQSAMIGTSTAAIGHLSGVTAEQIKQMQSNVAVGYAVCYVFGSFGPILLLSAIFPGMMGWNLRDEAKVLAKRMQGDKPMIDPGQFVALDDFNTRVYKLNENAKAVKQSIARLFEGEAHVAIEAVLRDAKLVELAPSTILQAGDIVAVTAQVSQLIKTHDLFGREILRPDLMQLTEEARHLVLTNKAFDGLTVQQFYQNTSAQEHYGVFLRSIARLGEIIKPDASTELKRGDELEFQGRSSDLDRISAKLGKVISAAKLTDFISFALGILLGILLGMITVKVRGVSISIGTGGGCLFSGLIVGWLRSRYPRLGALPTGASNFLRDFGLAVFVSTVGITAGPQAVTTIKQYGMEIFLLGVGVTIIPQILSFYVSYYILRIKNPIVLLSTLAGGRSANPGFAALLEKAGNATPVVPFTATYAIANIWLTLWGPIIVALVAKNVS